MFLNSQTLQTYDFIGFWASRPSWSVISIAFEHPRIHDDLRFQLILNFRTFKINDFHCFELPAAQEGEPTNGGAEFNHGTYIYIYIYEQSAYRLLVATDRELSHVLRQKSDQIYVRMSIADILVDSRSSWFQDITSRFIPWHYNSGILYGSVAELNAYRFQPKPYLQPIHASLLKITMSGHLPTQRGSWVRFGL